MSTVRYLEANELRLGNWVYNDENKPVKLVVIETTEFAEWNGSDCQFMFLEDGNYKYSDIQPIPLTHEILEKAGFEKSGTYWFKKHVYIWEWGIVNVSFRNRTIMDQDDDRCTCLEITSLHQLQNYYFALEGEELEIKL